MKLSQFNAVIYDMDGVLTDSEPIWKVAMEEAFHFVGCPLTRQDFQKTVGLRIDEVVNYWFHMRPWTGYTVKEVEDRIVSNMIRFLNEQAKPLPGVEESLAFFTENNLPIGLATSSYSVLIDTILDVLDIRSYFQTVHSAEFELYGKPNPAVYLSAAKQLGVDPRHCLVIEDSLNGIISGKAARMTVICVPEKTHNPEPKLILADHQFDNLNEVVHYFKENP
jgi:sugar-phosphatase